MLKRHRTRRYQNQRQHQDKANNDKTPPQFRFANPKAVILNPLPQSQFYQPNRNQHERD